MSNSWIDSGMFGFSTWSTPTYDTSKDSLSILIAYQRPSRVSLTGIFTTLTRVSSTNHWMSNLTIICYVTSIICNSWHHYIPAIFWIGVMICKVRYNLTSYSLNFNFYSHEQKHMLLFMKSTCLRVPNPFMSNITTVYFHASNFLCPQSETKDTIFRKTTKKRWEPSVKLGLGGRTVATWSPRIYGWQFKETRSFERT